MILHGPVIICHIGAFEKTGGGEIVPIGRVGFGQYLIIFGYRIVLMLHQKRLDSLLYPFKTKSQIPSCPLGYRLGILPVLETLLQISLGIPVHLFIQQSRQTGPFTGPFQVVDAGINRVETAIIGQGQLFGDLFQLLGKRLFLAVVKISVQQRLYTIQPIGDLAIAGIPFVQRHLHLFQLVAKRYQVVPLPAVLTPQVGIDFLGDCRLLFRRNQGDIEFIGRKEQLLLPAWISQQIRHLSCRETNIVEVLTALLVAPDGNSEVSLLIALGAAHSIDHNLHSRYWHDGIGGTVGNLANDSFLPGYLRLCTMKT